MDPLKARIEELEAGQRQWVQHDIDRMNETMEQSRRAVKAEKERDRLHAALKRYGRHDDDCVHWEWLGRDLDALPDVEDDCDCGLREALE